MGWKNKPVWSEGMFLRPQHFQQFERFVGAQLDGRLAPLRSHGYGIAGVRIDDGMLKTGKIAVLEAAGVFDDGAPFAVPAETAAPQALEVGRDLRDCVIYLCAPLARPGIADVSLDPTAQVETRFAAEEFEAADAVHGSPSREPLKVGTLQLSLRTAQEGLEGYTTLPIARVIERKTDDSVLLDAGFIPCTFNIAASPVLTGFLTDLEGMLHQRGESIAGRLATPGTKGVSDVTDVMMLMAVNRAEAEIKHLIAMPVIHPADFYRMLCALAAELATLTRENNRPAFTPPYSHREPRPCFEAVMRELQRALSYLGEVNAVQIPIEPRANGFSVAVVQDPSLFQGAAFVLAARGSVDTEMLRANLPRRVKIGSVEFIRDLVMRQLPGVDFYPMPAEPRQIPFRANSVYFSINTRHEQWQPVTVSKAIGLHLAGDIPGLELELWAIRGQR